MPIKEDFENLNGMIQNMDSQLEVLEDVANSTVTELYELDEKIKPIIRNMADEDIDNMTEDSVIDYLVKGFSGGSENTNITNLRRLHQETAEYKDKPFVDYAKVVFHEIKTTLMDVDKMKYEKYRIVESANKASDNYFSYVNSEEYKKRKMDRIEELRSKLPQETNSYKKRKMEDMINAMETSENLSFLFTRLDAYGDKEARNIKDVFFDTDRSTLVMNKFSNRLPRYGYNKDIYRMFFNIEEKFLPEEYWDLNNIFLFHVMRFISFTDVNDKRDSLYVSSILIKLYNLLYHSYETDAQEKEFIEIIKKVDDFFMPYKEVFAEYNTTSPKHPKRVARDTEFDEKRRVMIIASLQNEGIEPDTNLSTEELRAMLQDVIDKKTKEIEDSIAEDERKESAEATDTNSEEASDYDSEFEELEEIESEDESEDEALVDENLPESENLEEELSDDELVETEIVDEEELSEEIDIDEIVDEDNDMIEDATDDSMIDVEIVEEDDGEDDVNYIEPESEETDGIDSEDVVESENLEEEISDDELVETESDDGAELPVEDATDDSMIVSRRFADIEDASKDPEEITIFKDKYGCYYVQDGDMYAYCDENDNVIERDINEETILQLLSAGAVEKTTVIV
jgi:hypothetical protein